MPTFKYSKEVSRTPNARWHYLWDLTLDCGHVLEQIGDKYIKCRYKCPTCYPIEPKPKKYRPSSTWDAVRQDRGSRASSRWARKHGKSMY